MVAEKLDYLKEVEHIWNDIRLHGDCLTLKDMRLNGRDLLGDGMKPGEEVGVILNKLLQDVLEFPEHNEREYLLAQSRKLREAQEL